MSPGSMTAFQPAAASSLAPTALGGLRAAVRSGDPDALRATARQFEALLLNVLLKSMRETAGDGGLFGSSEQRTFVSLLDEQVANRLAERPGIGLADLMLRQIQIAQRTAGTGGEPAVPAAAVQSAPTAPITR